MSGSNRGYPQVGDVLEDRYRLDAEIAAGGMGKIFKAKNLQMDRDVAIKILLPSASQERDATLRFQREIQLITKLNHPHTITVFDFGSLPSGMMFLVMELLGGGDLRTYIDNNRPLQLGEVVDIIAQVLDALSEAHKLDIVHRDVKPSNVHLIEWGRHKNYVKLLDFGIAKSLKPDEQKLTQAGFVYGTSAYMAPERIAPQKFGAPGKALDVYSVGLICLEMVLGRRIFRTQNNPMNLLAQIETDVPIPQALRGTALEPVLARSLERFVARRYPDAEAMFQEFEAAASSVDRSITVQPQQAATYFQQLPRKVGGAANPFESSMNFTDAVSSSKSAASSPRMAGSDRAGAQGGSAPPPSPFGESSQEPPADQRKTEVWNSVPSSAAMGQGGPQGGQPGGKQNRQPGGQQSRQPVGQPAGGGHLRLGESSADETELVGSVPEEIEALRREYEARVNGPRANVGGSNPQMQGPQLQGQPGPQRGPQQGGDPFASNPFQSRPGQTPSGGGPVVPSNGQGSAPPDQQRTALNPQETLPPGDSSVAERLKREQLEREEAKKKNKTMLAAGLGIFLVLTVLGLVIVVGLIMIFFK